MNAIINISLNKTPITWKLIHCCLLNPFESDTKVMCHHQILTVIT